MIQRILFASLFIIFLPNLSKAQCLNGTYTFGLNNADFDSFFQLEQRIQSDGLCGPVEILIQSGTYSEDLGLVAIQGSSSVNTLTIRSESGNPADVILNAPVNSINSGVITLNFVQYATIEDITFRPSENSGTIGIGVNIRNSSTHVSLRNLVLEGNGNGGHFSESHALVYGLSASDILIENCLFENASYGIYGATFNQNNENWTIRNNHFNQLYTGMQLLAMDGVVVQENEVTVDLNTGEQYRGFHFQGGNIELSANKIISDGSALSINAINGSDIVLTNNMFSVFPYQYAQYTPVSIFGGQNVQMDFNTIALEEHMPAAPFPAIELGPSDNLLFRNNIIVNKGEEGHACRFETIPTGSVIDHNIYYSNNEPIQHSYIQLYSLEGWQETFQQDGNSRVILPVFTSATDLHLDPDAVNNQFMNATGVPVAGITTDIDGELRNSQTPDIGADEFGGTVTGIDVATLSTNLEGALCDGLVPVQLEIQNNSDEIMTYLEISWAINGAIPNTFIYSDTLEGGATINLTLDTTYLVQNENYEIVFNTNLPNGGVDVITSNNTLTANVSVLPKPQVAIVTPDFICPQSEVSLYTVLDYEAYHWSTGATSATIEAEAGIYELTVTDANSCTGTATAWLRDNDIIVPETWMTDGIVYDVEIWDDQIFIGGEFSVTTPYQPRLGAIERNNGMYVPFPFIDLGNEVHAIVSDGNGGYYVGGDFEVIGGKPRQNLAHINAEGEVSDWRADANGLVYALYLDGNRLFVGGDFTEISGRKRNALAVVSTEYGHTTDWEAPVFEAGDQVRALDVYEDYLVVGGSFSQTNPVFGSYNLFLIDFASGQFPNQNNNLQTYELPAINQIEIYQNKLYLGTSNGGYSLDLNTGESLQFAYLLGGNPTGIARNEDKLYLHNPFSVYEYDLITEDFTNWQVDELYDAITSIAVHNNQLILGGNFTEITSNNNLDALRVFDLATYTELPLTTYAINFGYTGVDVNHLYVDDERIIISGLFDGIGGLSRQNLFVVDAATGIPTDWAPDPNGKVRSIHTDLEQLYVGGTFTEINGEARSSVAAFAENGQLNPWSIEINGEVFVLSSNDDAVYVGGAYNALEASHKNLAAFDKTTGAIVPLFRPQPDDYVSELVVIDSVVIASGRYEILYFLTDSLYFCGGHGLSVLRADDSDLIRNYSLQSQFINDLKHYNGLAYIGGRFTSISSNNRPRIATVNPDTFPFIDWSHAIDDEVFAIALGYGAAFAQGQFTSINNNPAYGLGAMDLSLSNTSYDLMPTPFSDFLYAEDMETYNGQLWIGGQFHQVFNQNRSHLTAINLTCIAEDIDLLTGPVSEFAIQNIDSSNLSVQFQNQSVDASRFLWDFGDGQSSTSISPIHTYEQTGTYEVCLTADHSTGSSTTCETITFAPVGTGIASLKESTNWSLYPNPAKDELEIAIEDEALKNQNWDIEIYNPIGQIVQQAILALGTSVRNLPLSSALPSGSYRLIVRGERGTILSTTFVKQ